MLSDCWEDAAEKRMTVMSIPVKQSILRFDKGNIKKQDTNSFKLSPIKNEQREESKNKIKFSKRGNTKRARINSESIWRRELNQMDSWVILKEMSKKSTVSIMVQHQKF